MPVLNGIDAARLLKVKYPQMKVVFIMMHADPAYVRAAFEAGASAYLLKRCVGEELGQAMRAVQSGNFYITPLVIKDVVESMLRGLDGGAPSGLKLTASPREVLQLLTEGYRRHAQDFPAHGRASQWANHGTTQPAHRRIIQIRASTGVTGQS